MSTSVSDLILPATVTVGSYAAYRIAKLIWLQRTSPLRDLPGPEPTNWFFGNLKEIMKAEPSEMHDQWIEQFGPTIKYKVLLGNNRLYTLDTKALNHVLMNTQTYQKPDDTRYFLERVLGDGILNTEGELHKKQRRIMNPAFGPSQVRELTPIFVSKANELRDAWLAHIASESSDENAARIDIMGWLNRMTLDVIGLAGFNYDFNSIEKGEGENELNQAFKRMFQTDSRERGLFPILKVWFPPLRVFKSAGDKRVQHSRETMDRIGNQLLEESKATVEDSKGKRDLLSLLVRANMAKEIPDSQRLSNHEVLSQVPTFLIAGHETTSNATTWALYALSLNKAVQSKLRDELLSVDTDTPTMDELNALPYLDQVVRETMRLHSPVPATQRCAVKDDVLPLGTPIVDQKGKTQTSVRIRKGDSLLIPTYALGRYKALWGDDALEFRPERWDSLPEAVTSIPGVWGNTLAFLGGPRACIGYRFALVEMKALLFSLVRAFEYELAVPESDIRKKSSIVQRPTLRSDPDAGNQLPMFVKPYIPL